MRLLCVVMLMFAVAALGSVGCGQQAPKIATGTDTSFKVYVPEDEVVINQGEKKEVFIDVGVVDPTDKEITVTLKPDKGLTVNPATMKSKYSKSFKVSVTADQAAAAGSHEIEVTTEPSLPEKLKITVKVNEKK